MPSVNGTNPVYKPVQNGYSPTRRPSVFGAIFPVPSLSIKREVQPRQQNGNHLPPSVPSLVPFGQQSFSPRSVHSAGYSPDSRHKNYIFPNNTREPESVYSIVRHSITYASGLRSRSPKHTCLTTIRNNRVRRLPSAG